jgi:DnaJ-class molecular chaperone
MEERYDFYTLLGLSSPTCSMEEIKRAYRTQARRCHPDRTGTEETEMIKKINKAKEVLLDEDKRREYNQLNDFPLVWEDSKAFVVQETFYSDALTHTFRNHVEETPPIVFSQHISFAQWCDPHFRIYLDYTYHRSDTCEECDGYGWAPDPDGPIGKKPCVEYEAITKDCPQCCGKGYLLSEYEHQSASKKRKTTDSSPLLDSVLPSTASIHVCNRCYGTRRIPREKELKTHKCEICKGTGVVRGLFSLQTHVGVPRHISKSTGKAVLCILKQGNRIRRRHRRGDVHVVVTVNHGDCTLSIPVGIQGRLPSPPSPDEEGVYPSSQGVEEGEEEEEMSMKHSCEKSACFLYGLCVKKVPVPISYGLNECEDNRMDNVLIRHVQFTETGRDMVGEIQVPFHMVLMGLNFYFPTDLYFEGITQNLYSLNIQRSYQAWTRRDVPWTGDQWVLSGWGPPCCPLCTHDTFLGCYEDDLGPKVAGAAKSVSHYVPTFAPCTFIDLDNDTEQCALSLYDNHGPHKMDGNEEARQCRYSNLILELNVSRPSDYIIDTESVVDRRDIVFNIASFLDKNIHYDYGPYDRKRRYAIPRMDM